MWLRNFTTLRNITGSKCVNCNSITVSKCYSQNLETKYTEVQKEKILKVVNESDEDVLSRYEITKGRLKKFAKWKINNGVVSSLSDVELIDGFNINSATKLFDSIVEGRSEHKESNTGSKIRGQFLKPNLSEEVRKTCNTVLAVHVTANSVCWTLIDKDKYEVAIWEYFSIDYPDRKKLEITDILDISWRVTCRLPTADVYVMKGEATTLRAAGSDPNNPKMLAVNLQKAQMISMIVALIHARAHNSMHQEDGESYENIFKQRIYFLRPSLPYRLYGTLIGKEQVSTDQTIEMIFEDSKQISPDRAKVHIPLVQRNMFRSHKGLEKDMLGHCLLLALTFMDLCIYDNQKRLNNGVGK